MSLVTYIIYDHTYVIIISLIIRTTGTMENIVCTRGLPIMYTYLKALALKFQVYTNYISGKPSIYVHGI